MDTSVAPSTIAAALVRDDATHTYRHHGEVVPGVTSILRPLSAFDGIPRDVLEAKADLGRRVHVACQFHDESDLDESSIEADVEPYLSAYQRFLRESGALVLLNEHFVYEPTYRYAGQLDRVLSAFGHRWLVDLKTCFTTPMSAGPQTAAYHRALAAPDVTHRAALRLRADGTYRFDPLKGANDWAAFLACWTLHQFKEGHKQ